ncbi:hypothetical protein KPC83_04445 [Collinsella sp. zg1085]|uniref:hypothetical protein n=1 Tax=Collinsella sp. zg1085 TaxID=2844380 RepID=UPI001C0E6C97|nr:hypothetical protein [Collinsella sp. zg1085]QWT17101.1 hypothetical protein KPC83_04445 [Collinsella sp. zg1085]
MHKVKHPVLVSLICMIALIALIAVRAVYVTSTAPQPKIETYKLGEWIALNNANLINEPDKSGAYSFKVDKAELMSANEYIASYSKDQSRHYTGDDGDIQSVVVLTMTVKNTGTDIGGVDGFMWRIIPKAMNAEYRFDEKLFSFAEPSITSGMFAVAPSKEYATHIPFSYIGDAPFGGPVGIEVRKAISEGCAHLSFSHYPVRKSLYFEMTRS